MSKNIYLLKSSNRKDKRYQVYQIDNLDKKTKISPVVHFGSLYENYTIHKDEDRKNNYLQRHKSNENWNDLKTAGAWSRWILWNKPDLKNSITDMMKRFDIKIIF
jgi:hypothetical protein